MRRFERLDLIALLHLWSPAPCIFICLRRCIVLFLCRALAITWIGWLRMKQQRPLPSRGAHRPIQLRMLQLHPLLVLERQAGRGLDLQA